MKVAKDEQRLSVEQGLHLLTRIPFHELGRMATYAKERLHKNVCYYNINRHIDYSNVCRCGCRFCSFSRRAGENGAFELTLDQILEKAEEADRAGASELHIVGGVHPTLPLEFFEEMLARISSRYPALHLKCFTAAEIDGFAQNAGLSVESVFERLKKAGLGSIPGGGAEVFSERIRQQLFPNKISADRWLEIHRAAHRCGLPSNATMLYGHIESDEEIIDHLCRLRDLQDETGGFQAFVPLAYHPDNNRLGGEKPTGLKSLRVIATSRMMLDNIPHIKAYWVMLDVKLAQVALHFGANDLDGTVTEERITHAAGASSPQALTVDGIRHLISETGLEPVERTSRYERRIGAG
ncbi:MAG TPA: aminofutalosine synthase MqnE [bacterium]|nr:aminofutalosine synthase MqnE [bacterium]